MESKQLEQKIDDIICGEVEMHRWKFGFLIKPINDCVISFGEIDLIIETLKKHGWEYYLGGEGFYAFKP